MMTKHSDVFILRMHTLFELVRSEAIIIEHESYVDAARSFTCFKDG